MDIISEGKLKAGAAFIKLAAKYGAKLVRSKKHNVFRDAAGHQITAPKTTSDFRAIKNFESELKGRGFVNQETVSKVKDSLVKGSKETVLKPATKSTASKQTTFKDFTQKYQPNVQGPRKPNTPVKRAPVQGPESELAHRHRTAFDKRLDAVIKDIRGTKAPLPASVRSAPKPLTADEMEKLRKLNLTPKQRRKFREMGLLPEQMVVPRGLKKKSPFMLPKTEMEILKRLSNRKTVYDRTVTGKAMYPFSEENKHKDAKLNYQYKDVTNPKKPVDPIKDLKKGKV